MRQENEVSFGEVLKVEMAKILEGREKRRKLWSSESDTKSECSAINTIGIAFSGGGIRSATFNLGVLQALAALGLLKVID